MPRSSANQPAHVADTVQAVAQLHAEHEARATSLHLVVDHLTSRLARPVFVLMLTVIIVCWVALNIGMLAAGRKPFDEPPFPWLQGLIALSALYITVLILTTQRRETELMGRREQLTLELALLGERKSAKIIALLEELRRDSPMIQDRHDAEATALSKPTDPNSVLDTIKSTQDDLAGGTTEAV